MVTHVKCPDRDRNLSFPLSLCCSPTHALYPGFLLNQETLLKGPEKTAPLSPHDHGRVSSLKASTARPLLGSGAPGGGKSLLNHQDLAPNPSISQARGVFNGADLDRWRLFGLFSKTSRVARKHNHCWQGVQCLPWFYF